LFIGKMVDETVVESAISALRTQPVSSTVDR